MIIVEDGSNVANANSLVTVEEFVTYADERGFEVPEANAKPMLIKAMDYIRSVENELQGVRTYGDQATPFPRTGMFIRGNQFAATSIPAEAKAAQIQAALEIFKGVDLLPTVSGQFVKREKLGPLETEYSETVNADGRPRLTAIDSILSVLFRNTSGAFLTTRRV